MPTACREHRETGSPAVTSRQGRFRRTPIEFRGNTTIPTISDGRRPASQSDHRAPLRLSCCPSDCPSNGRNGTEPAGPAAREMVATTGQTVSSDPRRTAPGAIPKLERVSPGSIPAEGAGVFPGQSDAAWRCDIPLRRLRTAGRTSGTPSSVEVIVSTQGRPLANSVKRIRSVLRRALAQDVKWG